MNAPLREYIRSLDGETGRISHVRKKILRKISRFIGDQQADNKEINLIFICTHNSRRSQFCQIWTATLIEHLGLDGINIFSGGTEVTDFNPRAVAAVRRAGFTIEKPDGTNPPYKIYYGEHKDPIICFSKRFDHSSNPIENIAAIMTCSDADRNCPVVPGTTFRTALPYQDPKQADDTPRESIVYDERCRQIAMEMLYTLSPLT